MQHRYVCIQQSQQNRVAVHSYGGYAAVIVNRGVYMSCMVGPDPAWAALHRSR